MFVHVSSSSLVGLNSKAVDKGFPVHSCLLYQPTNLYPEVSTAVDPSGSPVSGFNASESQVTVPPPIASYFIVTLSFSLHIAYNVTFLSGIVNVVVPFSVYAGVIASGFSSHPKNSYPSHDGFFVKLTFTTSSLKYVVSPGTLVVPPLEL